MSETFWSMISAFGQWTSVAFTGGGFFLIWWQVRTSAKIAAADLILRIESEFIDHHVATYCKFQKGGAWADDQVGPNEEADVTEIEHYLDFFATLNMLRRQRLISLETIDEMFAFRFFCVANNRHTLRIMEPKDPYWDSLHELYKDWINLRKYRDDAIPEPGYQDKWLHGARRRIQSRGLKT